MDDPRQDLRAKLILSESRRRRSLLEQAEGGFWKRNYHFWAIAIVFVSSLVPVLQALSPFILIGSLVWVVQIIHNRIDALLKLLELDEGFPKTTLSPEQTPAPRVPETPSRVTDI